MSFDIDDKGHENPYNLPHPMIIIDSELYGGRSEFESIEAAEAAIRACGPDFEDVAFHARGSVVVNGRGDVVGEIR